MLNLSFLYFFWWKIAENSFFIFFFSSPKVYMWDFVKKDQIILDYWYQSASLKAN